MATKPDWAPLQTRTSRRLSKNLETPVKEFSALVGDVMWAWNYSHAAFSRLFAILISPANLQVGFAMWHTLHNDRTQRELLWAAAQVVLAKNRKMLNRVEWAKRRADALSTTRNDAAHLATAFAVHLSEPQVVLDVLSTAPKRVRRLENRDLNKTFITLYGDLLAMSSYVSVLGAEIAFPGHYSLPRRPKLLSIEN